MLEPARTLLEIPAETSVEEGVQSKPVRKRAPKKPRVGLVKGMRLPKSNRQKKLDLKVAGCELEILFARNDRIHKFTTNLVRNHHTIVVETLMP